MPRKALGKMRLSIGKDRLNCRSGIPVTAVLAIHQLSGPRKGLCTRIQVADVVGILESALRNAEMQLVMQAHGCSPPHLVVSVPSMAWPSCVQWDCCRCHLRSRGFQSAKERPV